MRFVSGLPMSEVRSLFKLLGLGEVPSGKLASGALLPDAAMRHDAK